MPHCDDCDTSFERADELEHEEVDEFETEDVDEGPPKIRIGAGQRDVWRCKECGKVLGVR